MSQITLIKGLWYLQDFLFVAKMRVTEFPKFKDCLNFESSVLLTLFVGTGGSDSVREFAQACGNVGGGK